MLVPPGTGVMFPATLQHVSISTLPTISSIHHSPHVHLPLTALVGYVVPMSITVQSGFRLSPLIFTGVPSVEIT